jgi:hypothetical protein
MSQYLGNSSSGGGGGEQANGGNGGGRPGQRQLSKAEQRDLLHELMSSQAVQSQMPYW